MPSNDGSLGLRLAHALISLFSLFGLQTITKHSPEISLGTRDSILSCKNVMFYNNKNLYMLTERQEDEKQQQQKKKKHNKKQ